MPDKPSTPSTALQKERRKRVLALQVRDFLRDAVWCGDACDGRSFTTRRYIYTSVAHPRPTPMSRANSGRQQPQQQQRTKKRTTSLRKPGPRKIKHKKQRARTFLTQFEHEYYDMIVFLVFGFCTRNHGDAYSRSGEATAELPRAGGLGFQRPPPPRSARRLPEAAASRDPCGRWRSLARTRRSAAANGKCAKKRGIADTEAREEGREDRLVLFVQGGWVGAGDAHIPRGRSLAEAYSSMWSLPRLKARGPHASRVWRKQQPHRRQIMCSLAVHVRCLEKHFRKQQ